MAQVRNMRGSSMKNVIRIFTRFPSTLSIHSLVLVNSNLALAPTGWGDSTHGRTVAHPGITLHRAQFTDIWNTMDVATMFSCFHDLHEPLLASIGAGNDPLVEPE